MSPESAFATLYGRQPSDAERLRLMHVKDALGLPDDDAIWALFIALGHHQAMYEEMPARIAAAATEAAEGVRAAAEAQTIARLANQVARTVEQIAGRKSWRDLIIAGAVAVALLGGGISAAWWSARREYDNRLAVFMAETQQRFDAAVAVRVGADGKILAQLHSTYSAGDIEWFIANSSVVRWARDMGIHKASAAARQKCVAAISN